MARKTVAVAYVRMSTDMQDTSPEQQREEILAYAEKNGFEIVRWYEDHGVSGDQTNKRLQFQQMIQDANEGRFKAIICWDQDRFGRFDAMEAGFWVHPLRLKGVKLVTVTDGMIDWDTFAGRMLYSMKQEGKHQYLRDLSDNVTRGMKKLARDGKWCSGQPPLGYSVDADRMLVLGPDEDVAFVKEMFERCVSGQSSKQLAKWATSQRLSPKGKPWTATGVRGLLRNPAYLGTYRYGKHSFGKYQRQAGDPIRRKDADCIIIEDHHPAIVDRATFDEVEATFKRNHKGNTPVPGGGKFALTSLIKCGHCGAPMHGDGHNGYTSYTCQSYMNGRECQRYNILQREALETILTELKSKLFKPAILKRLRAEMKRQLKQQQASTPNIVDLLAGIDAKLEAAERRLVEVSPDMVSRVEKQIKRLERERQAVMEKDHATPNAMTEADMERRIEAAMDWFARFEAVATADFDTMTMRAMLAEFIERVEFRFDRVPWGKSGKRFKNKLVGGTIHFKLWGVGNIPGPLLDRVDIHIEVPAVPFDELTAHDSTSESSAMM